MPEAVEGDLRFRVHDESVMQVWDQIRADCEGDEYRGASHPRDVFENLVGEIEGEYHDIIRSLRAALSRAEADVKRMADSYGIDVEQVVDDLKAWPGKGTDAAGDTLASDYVSKLMQQAAVIIETKRSPPLSRSQAMDEEKFRGGMMRHPQERVEGSLAVCREGSEYNSLRVGASAILREHIADLEAARFAASWDRMCLLAGFDAVVRRADTDAMRGTVSGCSIMAREIFSSALWWAPQSFPGRPPDGPGLSRAVHNEEENRG